MKGKNMKQRIFFDMDGTLAEWGNSQDDVTIPGYFMNRPPVETVVTTLQDFMKNPTFEVFILSSVFENEYSKIEKRIWNKQYTEVPEERQIYVPYGSSKSEGLKKIGGARSSDILIDDFTPNLKHWPGIGIKIYNGINGKNGTWDGFDIHSSMRPDIMVKQIIGIAGIAVMTTDDDL